MTRPNDSLEPIDPSTARELYLNHKKTFCSEATVQAHHYRTKHIVNWCAQQGVHNLNDLTVRNLHEFRLWHMERGDINRVTLRQHMCTLRVFLKWAASIDAVDPELYDKVTVPKISREERKRDEMLDVEEAKGILEHLSRYHFESRDHVLIALLWETGMRIGAVNSVDLDDVHLQEEYIDLVDRPEEGTTLKNGAGGKRPVAITAGLADLLGEYIENRRFDVDDDYGRRPLLTSENGQLSRSGIRRCVYVVTATCFRDRPCPDCNHGSDKKCREAVSPHAIRRGSITHFLTSDVPEKIVSDRMNVSWKVIEQHYDNRSAEVKLEQRRGFLENI